MSTEKPRSSDPAMRALDDICKLCNYKLGAKSGWEYPSQVVRDVALALGIPLTDLPKILK